MNNLLRVLLKNRKGLLLGIIALILTGNYLVAQLPITLYPNTTKTRIWVRIPHPSFTAEEFEAEYAERLSTAFNTVEGIDEIESTYSNGSSSIRIYFDWGFDSREARSLISAAMAQVRGNLPEESENYSVGYWAGRTSGFLAVAAHSDKMSADELFALLEPRIKPHLNRMKNMNMARINPVEETKVEIFIKPREAITLGFTPDQIATAIRRGYRNISLGSYRDGFDIWSAKINRHSDSLEDIENILIEVRESTAIKLSDVADVNIVKSLPRNLYSVNGRQAVVIFAMPDEGGNVRDMANEINSILEEVSAEIPGHISFAPLVDPGVFINNAISNVINAALLGGSLAIIIVFIFLGEIRNTMIIAVSIPLSIVVSFILMYMFGVTVNLISLGGLTLAVGMVIDSSIVVVENIHRHRREKLSSNTDFNFIETIITSVQELRTAIIASTLTSIVVFLPISFTSELTSAILGDLALAVIFALSCGLLVAIFIVPCLSYTLFSAKNNGSSKSRPEPKWLELVKATYQKALFYVLQTRRRSYTVILGSFLLMVITTVVFLPRINRELIAKPDSNRITLQFTNIETRNPEQLLEAMRPIEAQILQNYSDVVVNLFARVHSNTSGSFTLTVRDTSIRDATISRLQEDFPSSRNWRYTISRWDPSELPLPRTYDLKIAFLGPDNRQVINYMTQAEEIIRSQNVYASVDTEPTTQLTPQVLMEPRYPLIASTNSTNFEQLSNSLRILLSGSRVIRTIHRNEPMDIELTYEEDFISNVQELENYQVPFNGGSVRLAHFFDFKFDRGLTEILHLDNEPVYRVTADLPLGTSGRDRIAYEEQMKEVLADKLTLPDGYSYVFEDSQAEINESIHSLMIALTASMVLIFVILGAQFNSFVLPIVVLSAVPLGLIGVILSLYFANSTISLNSMLGTILLGGIVVNNSILLVDFFQQQRQSFSSNLDAIIQSCQLRLTPILITTLTTIFAMAPIALAIGDGTNVIQPLGIAVAGGLGVSTAFTLFVTPCILRLLPEDIVS